MNADKCMHKPIFYTCVAFNIFFWFFRFVSPFFTNAIHISFTLSHGMLSKLEKYLAISFFTRRCFNYCEWHFFLYFDTMHWQRFIHEKVLMEKMHIKNSSVNLFFLVVIRFLCISMVRTFCVCVHFQIQFSNLEVLWL